jgi:antitoxin MazE
MEVSVTRWGNSLGIRIPKEIAKPLALAEGTRVEIRAEAGRVILSPVRKRPVYALDDLLAGMTPEAMHEAFDWGPDLGRETAD